MCARARMCLSVCLCVVVGRDQKELRLVSARMGRQGAMSAQERELERARSDRQGKEAQVDKSEREKEITRGWQGTERDREGGWHRGKMERQVA